ncbi:MAG: hypothetical protein JSV86_10350 [Gemmatimonadota bacterium]|nr:MAG: hypothetical protein JSV86_10350 [Gemmatimonadota bacterium]
MSNILTCRSADAYWKTCDLASPLTHYVIVRADLPIGLQAAQIVHAAGESVVRRVPRGTNAVVLAVPSEDALRDVSTTLTDHRVDHATIIESDPPYTGQMTAIGVRPVRDRYTVRRCLSSLPLLR